jgi:urea carboxylase
MTAQFRTNPHFASSPNLAASPPAQVLEETPSPLLTDALRGDLTSAACRLGAAASYRSAGTVEFIFDEDESKFYFLEVNTRLQVARGIHRRSSALSCAR